MRGSCSVAMAMPVQRQEVHITLPVPLQVEQKLKEPSRDTSLPRVPHCAHGR